MTGRERLLTVLSGNIPDCVPVAPDFSNMIPAKMTGKPFWDLYLYNDPPIWEAYIECAKFFNIDAVMDGYFPLTFADPNYNGPEWNRAIVFRNGERIVTQAYYKENGKPVWAKTVDVYYIADPPTHGVVPEKIGLPPTPVSWEPVEGAKPVDLGPKGLQRVKELMGSQGLVGVFCTNSCALGNAEAVYHYYDHPELHEEWAVKRVNEAEKRYRQIMSMDVKPDFICVGGSGTLIWQSLDIFMQLAFPAVKKIIDLASSDGVPTHVHSCGPEKELVRIFAEQTSLSIIDPLEIPPMGDCNLKELKRLYGGKLILKGNLHTTDIMLRGSVDDVVEASRKAIDDAGEGGGFILSTGDQCPRDTPYENLFAMIETARTYGSYR